MICHSQKRSAFTLAEMLVVLLLLAALATVVLPHLASGVRRSRETITHTSLRQLRRVILENYRSDMFERLPYPLDANRAQHPQLQYLFVNPGYGVSGSGVLSAQGWNYDPVTQRGWSGPYLSDSGQYEVNVTDGFGEQYGKDGDRASLDAWGRPIIIQQPNLDGAVHSATLLTGARLVSAGPNGKIDTPATVGFTEEQQQDDLVLFFREQ